METVYESTHARVVEVGLLAHVQELTPEGWRTVKQFTPHDDNATWHAARSLAATIQRKYSKGDAS